LIASNNGAAPLTLSYVNAKQVVAAGLRFVDTDLVRA